MWVVKQGNEDFWKKNGREEAKGNFFYENLFEIFYLFGFEKVITQHNVKVYWKDVYKSLV